MDDVLPADRERPEIFVLEAPPTGIDSVDALIGTEVTLVETGVDSDLDHYVVVWSRETETVGIFYDRDLELLPDR